MRKYVLVSLIAIAVLNSCKNADKADTRMLSFNLQKGKTYAYVLDWQMDQEIMGRTSRINVASTYTINVTDDDGNVKTLTSTYDRFKMGFDMAGVKAEVDTDQPAPGETLANGQPNPAYMMGQIFNGIKGKSFAMRVDKTGKVVQVTGMEDLIKSMIPQTITPEQRMQMELSLKDQFNEQSVREQFGSAFNIFPGKEVKVGDSWDKSYQLAGKMPGQYNSTYTVKEIKGDDVTVDVKTTIKPAEGNATVMTGQQTGTLQVDSKLGLVTKAEFNQDFQAKSNDYTTTLKGKGTITGEAKK